MVAVERGMGESADRMALASGFRVEERRVTAALSARPFLAAEQRDAVRRITGGERIAAVVGLAGAGKSTMLAAAREAWEAQGFVAHGAALSGKAAEGLEESSGIASRTLASWEHGWQAGRIELGPRDVLVIDEAGMVSSRQLATFIGAAEAAGAKIVLVGDPEQLQPIDAGASFRAIAERIGFVELEGVRRQKEDWQRAASQAFARQGTAVGLAAYAQRGAVHLAETQKAAVGEIVRDVLNDMAERPEGSRIVLAHRRADVQELNTSIRAGLKGRGELADEFSFATQGGERKFAAGDRIIFLENNRGLGVKNGLLATVETAQDGFLTVRLDSSAGQGLGRRVSISITVYAAVDHGYATTIHKAQGATVDRSFVLASGTMDRHLTYVAMTRHREEATLYAGRDEFGDLDALSARLGRSQSKETTLDYAERRGIAGKFEAQNKIAVPQATRGGIATAKEAFRVSWLAKTKADQHRFASERESVANKTTAPSVTTQGSALSPEEKGRLALIEQAKAAFAKTRETEKVRDGSRAVEKKQQDALVVLNRSSDFGYER
jgi:Ti-type conjugative transfer relaxase TraA